MIAEMYDLDCMNPEFPLVRDAHDRNDEGLERRSIAALKTTANG
jgi:hypothetical protein